MSKTKTRSHGGNIYSRLRGRMGQWVYFYQKKWTDPETGETRKYSEVVPEPYSRRTGARAATTDNALTGLSAARAFKRDVDALAITGEWIPIKVLDARAATEREERLSKQDQLRVKHAWEPFLQSLVASGDEYADMESARRCFRYLSMFYGEMVITEITNADVRRFYTERMNAAGAFKGCRTCSIRTPQIDMAYLGALYKHLQECHPEIPRRLFDLRVTSRKKGSALAAYKPGHAWQIPGPDRLPGCLRALLTADPVTVTSRNQRRYAVSSAHRTFWALCLFTAARPKSEPCRLRRGDVEFLDDGWALVTYRDPKNEHSQRAVPVPPQVAAGLRDLIPARLDERFGAESHEAWAETLVFTKKRQTAAGEQLAANRPWDQASYKRAWEAAREAVKAEYPEVDGMWVRDLRKVAATALEQRLGVREATCRRFLGHVVPSEHAKYVQALDADVRAAAELLCDLVYSPPTLTEERESA